MSRGVARGVRAGQSENDLSGGFEVLEKIEREMELLATPFHSDVAVSMLLDVEFLSSS